ncbi:MAG: T9SS type A sorting domain-containing protein [Bacteroidota bacterium]|nr:T9SS type A sorting domain-containing protein [Bacteroidota bacterium]
MKYPIILSMFLFSTLSYSQLPPNPILGFGERWTNLWSVSYDYQSNGSVRYLVQDPANSNNLCAIMMSQQDSMTPIGVNRYVYYSYSDDYGSTWASNVLDVSGSQGFPSLALQNGIPVIVTQGFSGGVFKDLQFGGFSYERITGSPSLNYPQIIGTTNGNLVLCGSNPQTLQCGYSVYSTSWSPVINLPGISGPSGQVSVEAGFNGNVSIFGTNYNGDKSFHWYQSSDNGLTFSEQTIFPWIVDGADTLYVNVQGGFQSVYDASGNVHVIFSTFKEYKVENKPQATGYKKSGIYHWSQQTGLNLVASNLNVPLLEDTLIQSHVSPLCHPSIGITASGRIQCAFTTYLKGFNQIVQDGSIVNAGEIFIAYSNNNGASWSTPSNITNTLFIEEKHPSLFRQASSDSFVLYFERDMLAGNWVNVPAWGKAPVYGIWSRRVIFSDENKNDELFSSTKNYPNPFNPTTVISYELLVGSHTKLKVFNIRGNEVATLVNKKQNAGSYSVEFNGSNYPSGVYYYKLEAEGLNEVKKMILIK